MAQNNSDYRVNPAYVGDTANSGVVVDLSRFADRLAQYDDISADLTQDEEAKIVAYIKACHDLSHSRISKRYPHWLLADRAHDVWVPPEATAFREKAVIADTRAIADTVLTYMMAALTGRNPMFQLEGMNRKSRKVAPILERVLHMQMRRTGAEARIAQIFLDSIRYGFAPTKVVWDAKRNQNRIVNFDPRRTFPDPRVNWGDWEDMGYIIFSDFLSFQSLTASGLYPKLKQFPALRHRLVTPKQGWMGHMWHKEEGRGLSIDPSSPADRSKHQGHYFNLGDARVIDEAWVRMSGYEIGIPSIDMIWLVITIMDEEVCIRFQTNPYGQQFPVVIGGLFHDSHKTYSQSLYDMLLPLHDIATWMLRSRIDNVQAALNNLIFVDPTQVAISDLINRNPWGVVRTLAGAKPGDGVFIAQVPDVTANHWQDIQAMSELKQRVSAASDAQQGVPTSDGIRTATEIARLTQLGSQRLGVLSRIMSANTMRPLVNMMVGNIQDALSYSGSIRVDPDSMPSYLADVVQDGYIDFDVAKDLQGQVDYLVIDGTLPVEPTRNAETWMNMLQILNQTGLIMEYKAGKIVEEGIRALGVADLDRFRISEEERQQGPTPSQQFALLEKARGASVMPQDQLEAQVQAGNLIPASQAQRG
jgi:hypothetical protein